MMEALAPFHVLRPWWLLLLLPALALWWLGRRASDPAMSWRGVIDPVLLRALLVGEQGHGRLGPHDLLMAGCVIGAVAVAGPTFRREPAPFAETAPAMIVLKVTPSMLAADLKPSRLDRAKQKISDLLDLRPGVPTGLIAYAGSAHLVLPPTADTGVVKTMVDALSPDIMPRAGDALDKALDLARQVLADGGKGGAILVLADTLGPAVEQATGPPRLPVTILPLLPPGAEAALAAEARAMKAHLVALTLDGTDVAQVARRLRQASGGDDPAGSGQRWQEAGYWLTPLIALIVLGWFRRGWVLA